MQAQVRSPHMAEHALNALGVPMHRAYSIRISKKNDDLGARVVASRDASSIIFVIKMSQSTTSGMRIVFIPVDGLPLDLTREISQCTAEQIAEVGALLEQLCPNVPAGGYRSYRADQIERVRKLVATLRSMNRSMAG
jgi:hypothetical protein